MLGPGQRRAVASVPGEVVPADGFYSYRAKYLDENGAELRIPPTSPTGSVPSCRRPRSPTFEALCCEGMARVDGFLTADDTFVVNEINTIPGFTRISMYPKLFEASGIAPAELTDRLIRLAVERHEAEATLRLTPGE